MLQNPLANADTMNAPWGLESRFKLVMAACKFFSLSELADNYAGIGKQLPTVGNPKPLTVGDLLKYLNPRFPSHIAFGCCSALRLEVDQRGKTLIFASYRGQTATPNNIVAANFVC